MSINIKQTLEHSKLQKEFSSLLTYSCLFNEKTVYMKDGGFQAHFKYTARDMDSSTPEMLDGAAHAVMSALNLLEDGWMIETNVISRPIKQRAAQNHFQSIVPAIIDDSRRYYFSQENGFFQSHYYLSITYVSTSKSASRAMSFLVNDENKKSDKNKDYEYFESIIESFLSLFEQITTIHHDDTIENNSDYKIENVVRLKERDLVNFLMSCITGKECNYQLPNSPVFLDSYLSTEDFFPGVVPSLGFSKIKVLTIDDVPEFTTPAILDVLNYLGFSYRWSTRFIALSKESAAFYLKKQKTSWFNKAVGLMGLLKSNNDPVNNNDAASQQYSQVVDAMNDNELGNARFGFMTMNIVLMNEDDEQLAEAVYQIKKAIEDKYFKVREETINTCSAYLGSLPGHGCYNVRKPLSDSCYVSQVFPTSSVWAGEIENPCDMYPENSPALMQVRTNNSRVHNLNLHVNDVMHTIIAGPTGAGKSTLLQGIIAAHCKYNGSRTIIFDKNHSHREFVLSVGGRCIDALGGVSFSPLKMLNDCEPYSEEYWSELSFICGWIEDICKYEGVDITPERSSAIFDAVETLFHSQSDLSLDLLTFQEESLRQAFSNFISSAAKNILIGDSDPFHDFDVLSIDMTDLLRLSPKIYMPVVKIILRRLERLFTDRRPTIFLIEELKTYLKHEVFNDMLEEYLLTLRKLNVGVLMITQEVRHILGASIGSTILSQCFTKIFLPNHELQTNKTIRDEYEQIGLNEQQIDIIANAIPKRDYYLSSHSGNRLFSLDLDPLSLAFMGISKDEDINEFHKLYKEDDETWIIDWLY
jgi:type IV secretion system protein VirB4